MKKRVFREIYSTPEPKQEEPKKKETKKVK
jgi:hypothetical protein